MKMSKFNTYARRVDELARKVFAEYNEANAKLRQAEAAGREYLQRQGAADAQYAARRARAQADYLEAKEKVNQVKRGMEAHTDEVAAIRRELAAELEAAYSADPAQIDANTLELLKSGILKSHEFARLMNGAAAAGNTTMMRLIGKYARDAADEASKQYGPGDRLAVELRTIAHQGAASDGSDKLEAFDVLADAFRRTMRNPGMIPSWDQLTSQIIEAF